MTSTISLAFCLFRKSIFYAFSLILNEIIFTFASAFIILSVFMEDLSVIPNLVKKCLFSFYSMQIFLFKLFKEKRKGFVVREGFYAAFNIIILGYNSLVNFIL